MRSIGPDTFCKICPDLLCIATFVILQAHFGKTEKTAEILLEKPKKHAKIILEKR